jgi:AraC family transcriptional regulator
VIKHIKQMKVVGMDTRFISMMSPEPSKTNPIPALWQDFGGRMKDIPNRADDKVAYGVTTILDPTVKKTDPYEMRYIACVEVKTFDHVPAGMTTSLVPEGNYAIFTHKGSMATFWDSMNYVYKTWLPKSGHKVRPAPHIEIYDQRFNPMSETSEFEIGVPVE